MNAWILTSARINQIYVCMANVKTLLLDTSVIARAVTNEKQGDKYCEDFDECDYGTHDCSEIEECENGGSYFACICKLSYEENDTLGVCEYIDECVLGSLNCVQAESKFCFNVLGSFVSG